jgi:hypothetical protein
MSKRPLKLLFALLIIGLQSLVLWGLAAWTISLIFAEKPLSYTSALFLIGILIAAGLWSSNVAIGLYKLKPWAHTPALIIQLLVASIGVASFAGEFGNAAIGLVLLLPATVAFVLLFGKEVRELFTRR